MKVLLLDKMSTEINYNDEPIDFDLFHIKTFLCRGANFDTSNTFGTSRYSYF